VVAGVTKLSTEGQMRAEQDAALTRAETKRAGRAFRQGLNSSLGGLAQLRKKKKCDDRDPARLQLIRFEAAFILDKVRALENAWFPDADEAMDTLERCGEEAETLIANAPVAPQAPAETATDAPETAPAAPTPDEAETDSDDEEVVFVKKRRREAPDDLPRKKQKAASDTDSDLSDAPGVSGTLGQWFNLAGYWWSGLDESDPRRRCTASKKGSGYYARHVAKALMYLHETTEPELGLDLSLRAVLTTPSTVLLDAPYFKGKGRSKTVSPLNRFKAFLNGHDPATIQTLLQTAPYRAPPKN